MARPVSYYFTLYMKKIYCLTSGQIAFSLTTTITYYKHSLMFFQKLDSNLNVCKKWNNHKKVVLIQFIAWEIAKKQRAFFESFAKEQGFDPLKPNQWYKQSKKHILQKRVYLFLLTLYWITNLY